MKNLFLSIGILFSGYTIAQVNVYECGAISPNVTSAEVLNGAFGFYRPCIEFDENNTFLFSGDVNKDIKASEYIHIKEGFHAGLFNSTKGVHLRITEKSLYDVAVLNYPDLNAIEKLKKVEFGVDLDGEIEDRIKAFIANTGAQTLYHLNPFIEDDMNDLTSEISMHATFIHPSTWTVKERDFFYYHEYEQVGTTWNGWNDDLNDNNEYLMRVRFAPPRVGEWEAHFSITYDGNTIELPVFTFLVQDNNHPGFVKVHDNRRNLRTDDGIVFPLGHVFPGPYNRVTGGPGTPWGEIPNGTAANTTVADWNQYLGDIESYINQGGKTIKLAQTSYGNLIEFEELGNYRKRMHYAWEQDKIMDMCEDNNVLVNFNLLFQDVIMGYGQNGSGTVGDPWDYGTYGPDRQLNFMSWYPNYCYFVDSTLPSNQFLDPVLMNYHKQRTRYYVARYGYSPQIYTWELMSEPFHMDQFHKAKLDIINPATGELMNDEPATIIAHPGHQVAINAINTYHNVISNYIKNELQDNDHLITFDQSIVDETPEIYPYQCAYNEKIDIIGYNYYGGRPDKLIEFKDDQNGKNNLAIIEMFSDENETSMYKNFHLKASLIPKPIILSEAGHGSYPLTIQCFGESGNNIDVMTNGFLGVAGMHPWEGYQYGHDNQYDERQLWPATISAEKHMNSFEVTRVLNHWNGWWKQGRQIEKLQNSDVEEIKELQYYLSQSNEFATGYVRNRSYNINTAKFSGCVLPENSDGFHYPVDNFVSFDYQSGSQNSTYNRYLYVTGLEKKTYYEIKWFDFISGDLLMPIQIQETDNKYRMKLEHPQLSLIGPLRPIVWFSMEKSNFSGRPMAEEEAELSSNNTMESNPFTVYPNPFNENITVFTPFETSIEIYSVTGVFIHSYPIKRGETHLNLSYLNMGIYFLYSTLNHQTLKIIKQ